MRLFTVLGVIFLNTQSSEPTMGSRGLLFMLVGVGTSVWFDWEFDSVSDLLFPPFAILCFLLGAAMFGGACHKSFLVAKE